MNILPNLHNQINPMKDNQVNPSNRPRKFPRFIKRFVTGMTLFVLVSCIATTIFQTAAAEADRRDFPAPGNLIDAGGFKMHIYCQGEGSPTVILEALSGGSSSYWGWVQPEIAKNTRVCVYDRAGRAWSEPDPEPATLGRTARNLHTLLTNAYIEGPYVLVGHSLGGIYAREFADAYPDEVVGMVLVDAAHPEQFARYPEMLAESETYLRFSAAFPALARLGVARMYFALGGDLDFGDLAEPRKSELQALWSSPEYFVSQRAEILAGPGIFQDGQDLGGLGDRPLIVITAGQNASTGWRQLQEELATLSGNSLHITLENATHASLAFNPNDAHELSLAIARVVEAVRSGVSLAAQP